MKNNIRNSIIVAIIIFLIPTFVNAFINLLDNQSVSFAYCLKNIDIVSFSNNTYIDTNNNDRKSIVNSGSDYEGGESKQSTSSPSSNNNDSGMADNKSLPDKDGIEVTYRVALGTGQGMDRIKATDGNYYFLAALYKKNTNTLLTIYDDNGKIVSEIHDYDFNKAGSITANDKYIFINKQGNINAELKISYIVDAIQKYKENGYKTITSDFTKNYIVGECRTPNNYSSITYDRKRNKMYGSNCGRITEIKLNDDGLIATSGGYAKMGQSHKYPVSSQHNSGIAISGDYLFAGRFFEKPMRNVLDVYKCTFDTNGTIKSINHLKRITFKNDGMEHGEIEDISASDNYLYIYNHRNKNHGKRENVHRYSISSLVS